MIPDNWIAREAAEYNATPCNHDRGNEWHHHYHDGSPAYIHEHPGSHEPNNCGGCALAAPLFLSTAAAVESWWQELTPTQQAAVAEREHATGDQA